MPGLISLTSWRRGRQWLWLEEVNLALGFGIWVSYLCQGSECTVIVWRPASSAHVRSGPRPWSFLCSNTSSTIICRSGSRHLSAGQILQPPHRPPTSSSVFVCFSHWGHRVPQACCQHVSPTRKTLLSLHGLRDQGQNQLLGGQDLLPCMETHKFLGSWKTGFGGKT